MKKVCCIVDAYSSGNYLANEFNRHDIECIHVQSTKEIFPILKPSFQSEDFVQNFAYEGSLDRLIHELNEYEILCVIPGTETGVPLADQLSEELGVSSNGAHLSLSRRNKYHMIETIKSAGLRGAAQFVSLQVDELLTWRGEHSQFRPLVVKPLEGAGAEGVAVCHSETHVKTAFQNILGRTNKLGLLNQEVLIQEFIQGDEYYVNTVSSQGQHKVTDIWRHKKRPLNNKDFVYDQAELRDPDGEVEAQLIEYVHEVLDALEVSFGPAHTEVKMTPDGPCLIEMGTRLQGMSVPLLNRQCVGYGSVDLIPLAYLKPDTFLKEVPDVYALRKRAKRVNLISIKEGELLGHPAEGSLVELSSYFSHRWIKSIGDVIPVTVDYFTVPGFVNLVHESEDQLEKDYGQIRKWEAEGQLVNV